MTWPMIWRSCLRACVKYVADSRRPWADKHRPLLMNHQTSKNDLQICGIFMERNETIQFSGNQMNQMNVSWDSVPQLWLRSCECRSILGTTFGSCGTATGGSTYWKTYRKTCRTKNMWNMKENDGKLLWISAKRFFFPGILPSQWFVSRSTCPGKSRLSILKVCRSRALGDLRWQNLVNARIARIAGLVDDTWCYLVIAGSTWFLNVALDLWLRRFSIVDRQHAVFSHQVPEDHGFSPRLRIRRSLYWILEEPDARWDLRWSRKFEYL